MLSAVLGSMAARILSMSVSMSSSRMSLAFVPDTRAAEVLVEELPGVGGVVAVVLLEGPLKDFVEDHLVAIYEGVSAEEGDRL